MKPRAIIRTICFLKIMEIEIAVLVPCYNEAATIAAVVNDFRNALPRATIYVFDNGSTDATVDHARAAGARICSESLQGKGNVIRRMFADIEADVYLLVDGDDTYDAGAAAELVLTLVTRQLDMVVGRRVASEQSAYRVGHRFGNRLLTGCVRQLFGRTFSDMLSGYRVFSRRFAKSFPAHSRGFEIETELTVHALDMRMPVAEVATRYRSRPEGSESKLSTYRDGWRILIMIIKLFKTERPLAFFSVGGGLSILLALILATPLILTYMATGLVPRIPTAILCVALTLLGAILLTCGLILDTVTLGRLEAKRRAYLRHAALPADAA